MKVGYEKNLIKETCLIKMPYSGSQGPAQHLGEDLFLNAGTLDL
jgi:hypothetical protein